MLSFSNLRVFMRCVRALGFSQAMKLRAAVGGSGVILVQPKGYAYPIRLRRGTTDAWVFIEVIISNEYSLVPETIQPRRIVDAGANAGYGALSFVKRWPQAEIIAIEPDPDNFAIARENLKPYPQVKVVQGALTGRDGMVSIVDPSDWKYAIQVKASSEGEIPAYSMQSILKMAGWDTCDLVKMDIEGGELDVFANGDNAWLAGIDGMVIELHEKAAPTCTSALFNALHGHPFTLAWRGENLFIKLGTPSGANA